MKKAGVGFSLALIFVLLFFLASNVGEMLEWQNYIIVAIQGACAVASAITLVAGMTALSSYINQVREASDSKNNLYGESWNTKMTTFMETVIKADEEFSKRLNTRVTQYVEYQQKSLQEMNDYVMRFTKDINKSVSNFYDNNILQLQKVSDTLERTTATVSENQVEVQRGVQTITAKVQEVITFISGNNDKFFKTFEDLNKKMYESIEEKEIKWKSDMQYTIVQSHQSFTSAANDSHVRLISVVESMTKLFDSYIEEFEIKLSENLQKVTDQSSNTFKETIENLSAENTKIREHLADEYSVYVKSVSDSLDEVRVLVSNLSDMQEQVLGQFNEHQRELEQMNRQDITLLKELFATE